MIPPTSHYNISSRSFSPSDIPLYMTTSCLSGQQLSVQERVIMCKCSFSTQTSIFTCIVMWHWFTEAADMNQPKPHYGIMLKICCWVRFYMLNFTKQCSDLCVGRQSVHSEIPLFSEVQCRLSTNHKNIKSHWKN